MSRHRREAKFVAVFLAFLGLYGLLTWSRFITQLEEPALSLPALLYFAGTSAYLIGGIWLFLHKEWARKLILVVAGAMVVFCAVPTIYFVIVIVRDLVLPKTHGVTAAAYSLVGIPALGLLIWHLWVLAYFTRPHVKAHFQDSK